MQLQRERKGERVEFFTGDVSSTDGNGGTEAVTMVIWAARACVGCEASAKGRA
jgi:hypothetical protein